MSIIVDSYYSIGKSHQVCQDYAMHGANPTPYIIITDGCSSSENTDVGARILAHSAFSTLKFLFDKEAIDILLNEEAFGFYTILRAEGIVKELNLNNSCLDASLIVVFQYNDFFYLYIYGDGSFVSKSTFDWHCKRKVEYENEMPYYLSYTFDNERKNTYKKIVQNCKKDYFKRIIGSVNSAILTPAKFPFNKALKFTFSIQYTEIIFISSDGICSFYDENNENIYFMEALDDFTLFKTIKGEVMKRRAKRVLKDYAKDNVYPLDDVSFGVIINESVYKQKIS